MRGDQHTVNGLLAYILGTAQSDIARSYTGSYADLVSASWGIRVWVRHSDGSMEEVTGGSPVAIVTRTGPGSGIQSNTWSCPETSLVATDAIQIRVYMRFGTGTWVTMANWLTEQLGATQLDAITWTVYYYTVLTWDAELAESVATFYWGTSTYNSRIENFSYTIPVPPVIPRAGLNIPQVLTILNLNMVRNLRLPSGWAVEAVVRAGCHRPDVPSF